MLRRDWSSPSWRWPTSPTRAREAAAYYDVPVSDIRDLPAPVESAAISADNTPIEAQSEIVSNQSPPHAGDPLHGLLDGLNLDSETLLIIGLLFLLYNEHADNVLLLALAYLLL